MTELKSIDGGALRKRPPGRTEVLCRAELRLKLVVRRVVKTEDGEGEKTAWERDGESVSIAVGETAPELPALAGYARERLVDAALDLVPADAAVDAEEIVREVTEAVENTLFSVSAREEL